MGGRAKTGLRAKLVDPAVRDGLTLALAAALAGAAIWAVAAHHVARIQDDARARVAALAKTIASGVPMDDVAGLARPESPQYAALRSSFVDARQANPDIRRLVALLPGPGGWRPVIEEGSAAGGERLLADAPVRDREGRVIARVGVEAAADRARAAESRFTLGAWILFALLLAATAFTGRRRYRKRRVDEERNRNIHARLSIHRLNEVMARASSESDLMRGALEVMAEATGFERWALFRRERTDGSLALAAARGPVVHPSPDPETSGPGVCTVPLLEGGESVGLVQCLASPGEAFDAQDVALIRWLTAQLVQGLKRVELELRDQLLASYMRSTSELLIGFDRDGRITYANPAALRAVGDPGDALVGRSIDALFSLHEGRVSSPLLTLLRREGAFAGELVCHTLDHASFPSEATISKATGRGGDEGAWILVGRDIRERREREDEIRSRSEQLELINEQLLHANDRLAEASRMKNEFLANVSHELRTPLNAVIGFATLLEQNITESEEERTAFARSIRESAEHLLVVINDILDLAKVEAGRLELALENADAAPTIHAAAETLRPAAARKGLRLTVSIPPEPLDMRLDPARLRQVLLNLLGNAVKFTDKGEVALEALRRKDEILIVVRDTGIGVAKGDLARLFVKFSQVDGSFKRRHQGAGLGLVITKSLVQRMGGTIAMESEGPGLGTRVTLSFPTAAPPEAPAQHETRGAHA